MGFEHREAQSSTQVYTDNYLCSPGCFVTLNVRLALQGFFWLPCLAGDGLGPHLWLSTSLRVVWGEAHSLGLLRAQTSGAQSPLGLLGSLPRTTAPGTLFGPSALRLPLLTRWAPWPPIRLAYQRAHGTRSQPCQLEIKDLLHGARASPETLHFD